MSLVMTIVMTQPLNAAMILLSLAWKCLDRGSCKRYRKTDAKYTKQVSQVKYEQANLGDEIDLAQRYSDIVNFFFVTMMFSAGLPVLYPIAAFFFGFYYWADKWMIINFYRKPPVFDSYIALYMMSWEKWALLCHAFFTISMFSNSEIFIKACSSKKTLDCVPVYLYSVTICLIVGLWFLIRHVIVPACDFDMKIDDLENEANFFEHCSFETLRD